MSEPDYWDLWSGIMLILVIALWFIFIGMTCNKLWSIYNAMV